MKGALSKPKPETEPELRGIVGNRSKPETGKTGNRGNWKPGARYRIPAGQPENRTGTGSRVPDSRPASRKTGLGPEAGYIRQDRRCWQPLFAPSNTARKTDTQNKEPKRAQRGNRHMATSHLLID